MMRPISQHMPCRPSREPSANPWPPTPHPQSPTPRLTRLIHRGCVPLLKVLPLLPVLVARPHIRRHDCGARGWGGGRVDNTPLCRGFEGGSGVSGGVWGGEGWMGGASTHGQVPGWHVVYFREVRPLLTRWRVGGRGSKAGRGGGKWPGNRTHPKEVELGWRLDVRHGDTPLRPPGVLSSVRPFSRWDLGGGGGRGP